MTSAMTDKHTPGAMRAARQLRTLYGTVIMEAPEYIPSPEDGAEIITHETHDRELREALENLMLLVSTVQGVYETPAATWIMAKKAWAEAEAAIRKAKGEQP